MAPLRGKRDTGQPATLPQRRVMIYALQEAASLPVLCQHERSCRVGGIRGICGTGASSMFFIVVAIFCDNIEGAFELNSPGGPLAAQQLPQHLDFNADGANARSVSWPQHWATNRPCVEFLALT